MSHRAARHRRTLPLTAVGICFVVARASVGAATLKPESVVAWTAYIAATERRLADERGESARFLGIDFEQDASTRRGQILAGKVLITEVPPPTDNGRPVDVPSALVHDWRGAVFIQGVSLDHLLSGLQAAVPPQDDVLQSSIVERTPDHLTVFLRLRRSKVVGVIYDTEHRVRFERISPVRAASESTATKIAEVADANTPSEHELTSDNDHGYLWRWNAYWRYEQVPGGVIAECESVSLSRELPVMLFFLRPIVNGTAQESMARTLLAVKKAYLGAGD
jgi:hypothetical protein